MHCDSRLSLQGYYETLSIPAKVWYTKYMTIGFLDNLEESLDKKIPGYKQTPPDWCDDCNAAPGGECPDCGCTHNC